MKNIVHNIQKLSVGLSSVAQTDNSVGVCTHISRAYTFVHPPLRICFLKRIAHMTHCPVIQWPNDLIHLSSLTSGQGSDKRNTCATYTDNDVVHIAQHEPREITISSSRMVYLQHILLSGLDLDKTGTVTVTNTMLHSKRHVVHTAALLEMENTTELSHTYKTAR